MNKMIWILCFISTMLFNHFNSLSASVDTSKTTVNIIHAPVGSLVPDVVMDTKGVLHMVFAMNNNAYYIQSKDNGATFTSPIKVNSSGDVEFKMGERGPKLAVGIDGVIHVVWADLWSPTTKVYIRYTRSMDNGKTFENLKTLSDTNGTDGITVAADGKGHVIAFWHVMQPKQTLIPQATWLHTARSEDNGQIFKADSLVKITNHNGLACAMCMTRARIGADGNVYLVFRSADTNIRDFYMLKGSVTSNNFTAIRVNHDNWYLTTCPMVGPELTIAPDGRQLCAFMSRNKVYWALSDSNVTKFRLHVQTPANEINEIFPTAVANQTGEVLFLWQVGPMSTTGKATVKWATYSIDGTFTGQQRTVCITTSGTKATTFAGTDSNFYIVVNSDDTTRPTIPLTLAFDSLSPTTVKLHWNKSTDNIAMADYEVFMNNNFYLRTSSLNSIILVVSDTLYKFKVRAKDNSGNYSAFSNEIIVKLSHKITLTASTAKVINEAILIYPNPACKQLNVHLYHSEMQTAVIEIYNLAGQMVLGRNVHLNKGNNDFMIDIDLLPPGTYTIKIENNKIPLTSRFFKK